MRPRMLIIGATGFVGTHWARAAQHDFEVIGAARNVDEAQGTVAIDATDAARVRAAFDAVRPAFVTHLAALSDIDRCERERELADRINHQGAANVARECARVGARLLFTSTDAVFDGTRGIYYEHDAPSPPNWYGQTKARAEAAVAAAHREAAIVRLSLVLGRSIAAGNSYLDKVLANLKTGNTIRAATFEVRNPIDVHTLCRFFLELTPQRQAGGIFHLGASDKMTRYELTRLIAELSGHDRALVVPLDAPTADRAPRGLDDFLVTERVRQFCTTPVPTCREVIQRALV